MGAKTNWEEAAAPGSPVAPCLHCWLVVMCHVIVVRQRGRRPASPTSSTVSYERDDLAVIQYDLDLAVIQHDLELALSSSLWP